MAEANVGEIRAALSVDLTSWSRGLQAASAQLQQFQQAVVQQTQQGAAQAQQLGRAQAQAAVVAQEQLTQLRLTSAEHVQASRAASQAARTQSQEIIQASRSASAERIQASRAASQAEALSFRQATEAARVAAREQRLAWLEAQCLPRPVVEVEAVELMRRAVGTPDPWQERVLRAPAPRALWVCARQTGKSATTAVLALHQALTQPGSLILLLSASLRQSQELFKKVQEAYRMAASTVPLQAESALRYEMDNGSRIVALPGTEENIRGYSAVDLLVIDEASRVDDELYYAVRPMMAVSGGRLLALSTPWGKRGWFYKEWTEGAGWQRVCITAEQCPRISPAFLAEEQRTLPRLWYQSEYLCQFVDTIDQLFGYDDVMGAVSAAVQPLFGDDPWPI